MDGKSEIDLPSVVISHPWGWIGVVTNLRHPQQQRCLAAPEPIETYITPTSMVSGVCRTNSGRTDLIPFERLKVITRQEVGMKLIVG